MRTKFVAVVLLLSALIGGCGAEGNDLSAGSLPDRGKAVVTHLVEGDFSGVRANFNSRMRSGLTEAGLRDAWTKIIRQYGPFRTMGAPTVVEFGTLTVIRIPLTMARGAAEARVTFEPSGDIAGLYILRPGVPL
jgi:hypothetical protein